MSIRTQDIQRKTQRGLELMDTKPYHDQLLARHVDAARAVHHKSVHINEESSPEFLLLRPILPNHQRAPDNPCT